LRWPAFRATSPPMTTLRTVPELIAAGLLPADARAQAEAVAARYAVAVTPAMAALVDPSDPYDPIAAQFLPDARELTTLAEERADPIGDEAHSPVPGIVHRYPDRVLLKPLHACPVYCRFCFRREIVGPGGDALDDAALETALAYVTARPAIFEVIVTGGDPLMLSARRVARITEALAAIPHVKVARWHTRVPLVAPERLTADLVEALKAPGLATYVGLHGNHAREFTARGSAAIARLVDAGIPLVSQTVLLKGINDDVDTLEALMRAFLAHRVTPYYLHQGDLAPGTSHRRTTIAQGRALMRALRRRLSGLAQPTYVVDVPDGAGKVPIGPVYFAEGGTEIETVAGGRRAIGDRAHPYSPHGRGRRPGA
jgi:lysine 2,3-aminomutase